MIIDNEDVKNFINTALEFYSGQVLRENYSINDANNLNNMFIKILEKKFKNHEGKEQILSLLEDLYKLNTSTEMIKFYKGKNNKECIDIMMNSVSIQSDKSLKKEENIILKKDDSKKTQSSFEIIISTYLSDLKRTSNSLSREEHLELLVKDLEQQYILGKIPISYIMDCLNNELEINIQNRKKVDENIENTDELKNNSKRPRIPKPIKKKQEKKILEIEEYMSKSDLYRINQILDDEELDNDFKQSLKIDSLNLEDEKNIDGSYIFENDKGEEVLLKRIKKYEYISKSGEEKVLEKFLFKFIDRERMIQSVEFYAGFDLDKFGNIDYADFCISKMFDTKYMTKMFTCNKGYLGEVKDLGDNNFEFSKKSPEQKRKINSLEMQIFMEQINKGLESLKR